jgi:hypothetical protein
VLAVKQSSKKGVAAAGALAESLTTAGGDLGKSYDHTYHHHHYI